MDENAHIDLTRRRALAAIGSIGVASAGAGLGTSAYFSDQETFENNQLTAGTLDMKVAATEYYSDWSPDEAAYAGMASDEAATDIRLPPGGAQADARDIAIDIDGDNYANFFDAISTDEDGDPYNRVNGGVSAATDGLCGTGSDADGPAIIDISDVKPGDFGGAQFAFELCDNPGYVWLTGGLDSASENDVTEPEDDDPDEESGVVELLDAIQVTYSVGPINGDPSGFEDTDAGFQPVEQYTLREFLATLDGDGIALDGNIDAAVGGGTGEQGCFAGNPDDGSAVHQVSVVWWLPVDHGNQVQSDSATFELGFYTEQCRHNAGETDLVAYYPFENSADDLSGNGYDGSNSGDVSYTNGQIGRAASFDGESNYVELPSSTVPNWWEGASLSVSLWFRTTDRGILLGNTRGPVDPSSGWVPAIYVDTAGRVRTSLFWHGQTSTTASAPHDDGNWHHLAVTLEDDGDATTGDAVETLYLDGSQVDQRTGLQQVDYNTGSYSYFLGTGKWQGWPGSDGTLGPYTGDLDDVRVYSRALSASEVQSLYDSA